MYKPEDEQSYCFGKIETIDDVYEVISALHSEAVEQSIKQGSASHASNITAQLLETVGYKFENLKL
jgi:hypothetical protein